MKRCVKNVDLDKCLKNAPRPCPMRSWHTESEAIETEEKSFFDEATDNYSEDNAELHFVALNHAFLIL